MVHPSFAESREIERFSLFTHDHRLSGINCAQDQCHYPEGAAAQGDKDWNDKLYLHLC